MTTLPHENPLTEAQNRALDEELRAAEAAGRKLLDQLEQERRLARCNHTLSGDYFRSLAGCPH